MTRISQEALVRGTGFVPLEAMRRFAGGFSLVQAQHKANPEDFVVEEQPKRGPQTTVSPKSDYGSPAELDAGTGQFLEFTLVTKMMTTSAGVKGAANLLDVEPSKITVAGNKDRTAKTSQKAVVEISDLDFVRRRCYPSEKTLSEHGFFIKDVLRTNRTLSKGQLAGNRFHIKLLIPGMSAKQLEDYIVERLNHLLAVFGTGSKVPYIPNFFGRQRLGRRQNLLGVGHTLITEGLEAGVKRFMCEVVEDNDHPLANKLRSQIAPCWEDAERSARAKGETVAQQYFSFIDMRRVMETPTSSRHRKPSPSYKPANMFIEHTLASEMAKWRSFEEMIRRNRSVRDDVSLWNGAYQSYWANQVLGRVLDGDIPTSALETGERDGELLIPLYFPGDAKSVKFYQQVCPEAIPDHIDPVVEKLFLTNFGNRRGPRRPAFVHVNDLEYSVRDGEVSIEFLLRSGAYATNFLSLLFNLDSEVGAG